VTSTSFSRKRELRGGTPQEESPHNFITAITLFQGSPPLPCYLLKSIIMSVPTEHNQRPERVPTRGSNQRGVPTGEGPNQGFQPEGVPTRGGSNWRQGFQPEGVPTRGGSNQGGSNQRGSPPEGVPTRGGPNQGESQPVGVEGVPTRGGPHQRGSPPEGVPTSGSPNRDQSWCFKK
jgi:hypothetical protein